MDRYAVFVEGLSDLDVSNISPLIERSAFRAINKTADFTRTSSARNILRKINFPGNYLDPSSGRLVVSKRARTADLESIITARRRATSLARFMLTGTPNKQGVVIQMKKGKTTELKGAFPIKLKAGSANLDTKSNMGLAIRLKEGKRPNRAYAPKKIGPNLWLLYGVSVDQAFKYVKDEEAPKANLYLESEFMRLLTLEGI